MDEPSSSGILVPPANRAQDEAASPEKGIGPEAQIAAPAGPGEGRDPGNEFGRRALEDAEYLLNYAMEAGIEVNPEVAQRILDARRLGDRAWCGKDAGALVAAITKLAKLVKPVTAECLRACQDPATQGSYRWQRMRGCNLPLMSRRIPTTLRNAHDTIRLYRRIAIWLAIFIIPLSMISFIYTGISKTITPDLDIANALLVRLHTLPNAPTSADSNQRPAPETVSDLQQFAVTMRAIYAHSRELGWIVPFLAWDPFGGSYTQLQLPPDMPTVGDLQKEVTKLTPIYQEVRLYATNVLDATSVIWGAIATCVLPVLYALLGACAYLLQVFSEKLQDRTFSPSRCS